MQTNESKNLIGCCGLYCGLCNKYQSKAPSRCIGCRLGEQHSWCSIWNCCIKKHQFENCAECSELFTCEIFVRRKVVEWIPAADNLRQIKVFGVDNWLKEQEERQTMLEELLQHYNEGRSMNLYCKACARMPIDLMNSAIKEANEKIIHEKVDNADLKSKAKILRTILQDMTLKVNMNLD